MDNAVQGEPNDIAPGPYVFTGSVNDMEDSDFWTLYRRYGAIHFKAALTDADGFSALTDRFGRKWLTYQLGGRDSVSDSEKIQTVNTGLFGIAPHSELCHSPGRPEMAWLFCERPPVSDGQTTLYDGVALAEGFPAQLRPHFAPRGFLYPRCMPLQEGLDYYGVASTEELLAMIAQHGWEDWVSIEDDKLVQTYGVPAFPIHPGSGREVFVNQIIHNARFTPWYARLRLRAQTSALWRRMLQLSDHTVPGRWRFTGRGQGVGYSPLYGDGSIIPRDLVKAVSAYVRKHEQAIEWGRGDVLVFDNVRYMHGRRQVADKNRRILTRFGNTRPGSN